MTPTIWARDLLQIRKTRELVILLASITSFPTKREHRQRSLEEPVVLGLPVINVIPGIWRSSMGQAHPGAEISALRAGANDMPVLQRRVKHAWNEIGHLSSTLDRLRSGAEEDERTSARRLQDL